jgi:hypothetical protein
MEFLAPKLFELGNQGLAGIKGALRRFFFPAELALL